MASYDMHHVANAPKLGAMKPIFEHVMTDALESFLWRCDPYPWERNVWNFHPEVEVHLIRSTCGTELVGDHIGTFNPGRLAIVGGGLPHDWVTPLSPGERIEGRDIVVQFDAERFAAAAALLPELAEIPAMLARASRGLGFYGETRRRGADLLERIGELTGLERLGAFLAFLSLVSRSSEFEFLSSEGYQNPDSEDSLDVVQKAHAYTLENFTGDLSLKDLAAKLNMSESSLSRLFKRNIGNSFTDHVSKLRINLACKLLAETALPITEICFTVGYHNLSNFNIIFKKLKKLTPSIYRRLAAERSLRSPNEASRCASRSAGDPGTAA